MPTADEIKHWLAVVANARLAVGQARARIPDSVKTDRFEWDLIDEYLENAFVKGLTAHGEAVAREILTPEPSRVA